MCEKIKFVIKSLNVKKIIFMNGVKLPVMFPPKFSGICGTFSLLLFSSTIIRVLSAFFEASSGIRIIIGGFRVDFSGLE